ncbi:Peptide deformylase [Pseudobythopirellula maris]|uniref:Peptide deformylase n=1 Tax=Pseudobythopirellula maris TaxID=2527991 RepID=A0A5C5ZUZ3_9BACT|nr:peptide deformylase [Pseudobythopirellula maris]TWT90925.1 Peptide deformylase [Pseudobythopirellula maris]
MSLEVIHYPHPTLRHKSKPLARVDAQLKMWVEEMFDLMYEHEGIGLAANQVDLPYRLFVMNVEGDPDRPELERVFINPVISQGKGQSAMDEGCLSLPGVRAPVTRNAQIRVQAYDLQGNEIDEQLTGMEARVVLHETDHLDGVLFTDKLQQAELAEVRDLLEEFEIAFQSQQESGEAPTDTVVAAKIAELEAARV